MSYYSPDQAKRDALIKGMRELLDFLADNPDVPMSPRMTMQVSTWGETMAERVDAVAQFAERVGVSAGWDDAKAYYTATRMFGPVEFFCVAIDRDKAEESES